ncbi:hypothetical protein [Xanthomonas vesicatoria]|uniref:hypothetical protein n=1 Tax=Xanthomonas vesicatoria TaxID=56460 RepID=UPI001E6469A6|nr:hypothetical protein [Xanthomonas vesicatoria]MCC8559279.1 hypothetical protein [Xanthomonas vesicatoria]MCC8601152.1 hypothetical protein [Xanthomonas vesicatoria]MCC8608371.1 hypothetical protein [Xanthomonas vesicatoria]MCC8673795.1 hypothetical protein [Xanthomonas vesicatoria]MCC8677185.1 hypothetical protein [Xanthomonas vesicatoria]
MTEQIAHIELKPLTWTLGIGAEAAQGSPATVGSMQMTAVASMYALVTTDGLDLAPFTWEVSISDRPAIGLPPPPHTVGMVSCYPLVGGTEPMVSCYPLVGGTEPGAELAAFVTLTTEAMRNLVSSAANGFVPTAITLEVRTKPGEATPEGFAFSWDTDNEPEIEIAKVEVFTTRAARLRQVNRHVNDGAAVW